MTKEKEKYICENFFYVSENWGKMVLLEEDLLNKLLKYLVQSVTIRQLLNYIHKLMSTKFTYE